MDFITKVRHLTYNDFTVSDYSDDEKDLYHASKAFLASDEKQAEEIAKKIYLSTADMEIKNTVRHFLYCLLVRQERFSELPQFDIPNNTEEEIVISLLSSLDTTAKTTNNYDCLELLPHPFEQLFITVQINSVDVVMLIDTGCQLTTISETTAQKCNITANTDATDSYNTYGEKISVYIAPVNCLSIGKSTFYNSACTVVPDSMITIDDVTIDGILGWETISKLKWEFDMKQKKVIISAPKNADLIRNLVYDQFLMVTVNVDGKKMTMGMDTGASHTQFGTVLSDIFSDCEEENITTSGAGSSREERVYVIPRVSLSIGDGAVQLENVNMLADYESCASKFFITPGVLGFDIAKDKTMTIDWFNRHLSVR